MNIQKFTVSADPQWYHAWPDLTIAPDGYLLCVFSECTHHTDRSHTRIMLCGSSDRGRTWTAKRALTEATGELPYYYNCARIFTLADGRTGVLVDRIPRQGETTGAAITENVLYWSSDSGRTWSEPVVLPLHGIVPDKLCVLDSGRWLVTAHYPFKESFGQFLYYSDDQGKTWSNEILVAHDPRYFLCEASLLPLGGGVVAAFMRENSHLGYDCFKTVSRDGGETWGPVVPFPLPACHRPVTGFLQDGRILITYRFAQGASGRARNFFGALTDRDSVLAEDRQSARIAIFPIDYDAAEKADLGYSGWVQFPDGEVYIVSYIVDDMRDKGQIRGYSLRPESIISY